jgi:hypothetical protein
MLLVSLKCRKPGDIHLSTSYSGTSWLRVFQEVGNHIVRNKLAKMRSYVEVGVFAK